MNWSYSSPTSLTDRFDVTGRPQRISRALLAQKLPGIVSEECTEAYFVNFFCDVQQKLGPIRDWSVASSVSGTSLTARGKWSVLPSACQFSQNSSPISRGLKLLSLTSLLRLPIGGLSLSKGGGSLGSRGPTLYAETSRCRPEIET
jgi:hypothetical protein